MKNKKYITIQFVKGAARQVVKDMSKEDMIKQIEDAGKSFAKTNDKRDVEYWVCTVEKKYIAEMVDEFQDKDGNVQEVVRYIESDE